MKQREQDSRERTAGDSSRDRTAETEQRGDNMTPKTGQLGNDNWDISHIISRGRTARRGQPEQDNQYSTAATGQQGKDSLDRV
jgi:hypothetical protein